MNEYPWLVFEDVIFPSLISAKKSNQGVGFVYIHYLFPSPETFKLFHGMC